MVPDQQINITWDLLEMQIVAPQPLDSLNQKHSVGVGGAAVCVSVSRPGDAGARPGGVTIGLAQFSQLQHTFQKVLKSQNCVLLCASIQSLLATCGYLNEVKFK